MMDGHASRLRVAPCSLANAHIFRRNIVDGDAPSNIEVTLPSVKGIDLFAGAGGYSLGAMAADIDIVAALEIHKHASATYEANIARRDGSKVALIKDDILTVTPQEAMRRWSVVDDTIDIVIGGPPCQGFSSHRINDAGIDDPRNKLLGRYFEYVEAVRPRIFLVENVPGLLWDRHKTYLEAFYARGVAAEFDLKPAVVINARDFGVPQNRRRVFILGTDSRRPLGVEWPPEPTHVSPAMTEPQRNGRPSWRTAGEVFVPTADGDLNDLHMQHSEALVALFAKTPPNGGSRADSGRILKCHEDYDGHSDVYGRINPERPGPTMTTACINPSKGRFVHPTENHGITLRQAARLQTFPDSFTFRGGLMSAGEQIGNAVPVALGTALLRPLVEALSRSAEA
jgi:DNA (cytosine-5)-methyltransferase 1